MSRPSPALVDFMDQLMLEMAESAAVSGNYRNVPSGFILDVAALASEKPVLKRMAWVLYLEDKKP